jgi:hypothetical protein
MRPFFIGLSVALGFSINPMVLAQSAGPELQGLIRNFQLTRGDISRIIDLLLNSERISQTQAHDAKDRLKAMSDQEIKNLSMKSLVNVHEGEGLFADEKAHGKNKQASRAPAQAGAPKLPASPFFSLEEVEVHIENSEERYERERLEKIQKDIHKNLFKKKMQ